MFFVRMLFISDEPEDGMQLGFSSDTDDIGFLLDNIEQITGVGFVAVDIEKENDD